MSTSNDNANHLDFLKATATTEELQVFETEKVPVATAVANHMPRERVFDDHEQKVVAGRLWLISFTDLFSIVLCMFIMIYSMRDPDMDKVSEIVGSKGGSGMQAGAGTVSDSGSQKGANITRIEVGDAINLDYLEGVLKHSLDQVKLSKDVSIAHGRDHLKLVIDGGKLFTGNAVSEAGNQLTRSLAQRLMLLSNRITVVGFAGEASDWGAGLAVASAFGDALREGGYSKPFAVVANGAGIGRGIEIRVEADDGRLH